VDRKDEHYDRFLTALRRRAEEGGRILLFGTPYLLKELVSRISATGRPIPLPAGSQVVYGGGWKALSGERISREELEGHVATALAVPGESILEGYSMTEIHGLMLRCPHDRYHVPPCLAPVVLDSALRPLEGADVAGTLAVIDPFARSYPGFVLTGDNVRLLTGECSCGLEGAAIAAVERAPGREVKGCGGIMATVSA
jgi:hypothetical protein